MTDAQTSVEVIASQLTEAQRALVMLEPGEYAHNSNDILALLDARIWGTCPGPLYEAVRAHLSNQGVK